MDNLCGNTHIRYIKKILHPQQELQRFLRGHKTLNGVPLVTKTRAAGRGGGRGARNAARHLVPRIGSNISHQTYLSLESVLIKCYCYNKHYVLSTHHALTHAGKDAKSQSRKAQAEIDYTSGSYDRTGCCPNNKSWDQKRKMKVCLIVNNKSCMFCCFCWGNVCLSS